MAATAEDNKFMSKVVHDNFSKLLSESDDDVDIELYVNGYRELQKFTALLGTVFRAVTADLEEKIDILNALRKDEKVDSHYRTVRSTIEYERKMNILSKKINGRESGSTTMLRLHKGLDFVRLMMRRLSQAQNTDKASTLCQESYEQTLGKDHPWVARKAINALIYTIPTREQLLRKVCGDSEEEYAKSLKELPPMLDEMDKVFMRVDDLYTEYNVHSLL